MIRVWQDVPGQGEDFFIRGLRVDHPLPSSNGNEVGFLSFRLTRYDQVIQHPTVFLNYAFDMIPPVWKWIKRVFILNSCFSIEAPKFRSSPDDLIK